MKYLLLSAVAIFAPTVARAGHADAPSRTRMDVSFRVDSGYGTHDRARLGHSSHQFDQRYEFDARYRPAYGHPPHAAYTPHHGHVDVHRPHHRMHEHHHRPVHSHGDGHGH